LTTLKIKTDSHDFRKERENIGRKKHSKKEKAVFM